MRRTIGIFLLVIMIAVLATVSVASTQTASAAKAEIKDFSKDETVYANLNPDGSINGISIVNRFVTQSEGIYTDYGSYEGIKNLTNNAAPRVDGSKVIWELPASGEGFYYEGIPVNKELPVNFSIAYALDGKPMDAKDLTGKSGKVSISLKVSPNGKANSYFTDKYLTQVQVPLSLAKCSNIVAEGAQSVIVGGTDTLAFMVFPGSSKEFVISFDAENFEMDGISATVTAVNIKDLIGFDTNEIKAGSTDLSDGTKELVSGTEQLKQGVSQLAEGIKKTASGLTGLISGGNEFKKGLEAYMGGVSSLSAGAEGLSQGLSQLDQNGAALSEGYLRISNGTMQLLDGILAGMAPDQQAVYSMQIEMVKQQLSGYGKNLDAYTQGVSESSQGAAALSGGIAKLVQQNPALLKGAAQINDGLVQIRNGLDSIYSGARLLPDEIQKLNDGQKKLSEGIDDALSMLGGFGINTDVSGKPVSFADHTRNVSSVQFIIKTPELRLPEQASQTTAAEKPKSFWEKLTALFTE